MVADQDRSIFCPSYFTNPFCFVFLSVYFYFFHKNTILGDNPNGWNLLLILSPHRADFSIGSIKLLRCFYKNYKLRLVIFIDHNLETDLSFSFSWKPWTKTITNKRAKGLVIRIKSIGKFFIIRSAASKMINVKIKMARLSLLIVLFVEYNVENFYPSYSFDI